MKKQNSKTALFKKILRLGLIVICGAVLGFNIYSANASSLVGNKLPMPFGYGAAVVLSGSMEPELSKGDLVIVKETDSFEVKQVVVFQDGHTLVMHRIIEIGDEKIVTKGDANNSADAPIDSSRIKGEVVFVVPGVGDVIDFIKTPAGTLIIIALAILLLEIPRRREKKKDAEELEKIREEIERLKAENATESELENNTENATEIELENNTENENG